MKKFLLLMMGLFIFSLGLFAEIPHSYVTENPDKEVTQTETLKKYKEKAELNLSVTKLNSEEIEGFIDSEQNKIFFTLDNTEHEIQSGDHIYVSEELQEVPSISTTNGRRKINGMLNQKVLKEGTLEYTVTNQNNVTEIEIRYSNNERELQKEVKEIYIGILDSHYQLKKILKSKQLNLFGSFPGGYNTPIPIKGHKNLGTAYMDIEITDEYDGDSIYRKGGSWAKNPVYGTNTEKGIKILGYTTFNNGQGPLPFRGNLHQTKPGEMCAAIGRLEINNIVFAEAKKISDNPEKYYIYTIENRNNYYYGTFNLDSELNITLTRYNHGDEYGVKLNKFPKRDFEIKIYMYGVNYFGTENARKDYSVDFTTILRFKYKSGKLEGISNLNIDKSYNQEYIPFTSCTIENKQNIDLERAITGVTLSQISGKGLLNLEANDILELNGKSYTIGAGGNLGEHSDTIGKVNFTFKVENGKLRLRVDEYGIRITEAYPLTLKVTRENNETNKKEEVMLHTMNIKVPYVEKISGESLLEVKEYYPSPEYIAFNSCSLSSPQDIALENALRDVKLTQTSGKGLVTLEHNDILEINGKQYTIGFDGNLPEKHDTLGNINFKFKVENGKFRLALTSWGVLEPDRLLTIKAKRVTEILDHKMTLRVPRKIEGTSTLTFKEYYPAPSYVEFNGCTLANPQSLALENSLRDVYLESSNRHGILLAEQGDKIEVNGKQYVIGAGGNLAEQTGTIGTINFKFKVENGKFRLALKDWGILEPKRDLVVRIIRGTNEVSKHTIGITSPRRVEGTSTLKFTEKYPIRDIVRFQGISLTAPNIGGIEPPIPAGVSYKSNDGYGIPFMKEGDILEVQCETMRATQKYIIDSKNSLKHQTIDLPGTVLSLLVEDGKLRLGLNNWLVNKNTVLNFRVIRGVNEISKTSITLEVPKAPFDILKNGILDFGKLIQGSKNKKAETSILLEMHQDISNVKFSLSTTTPELVNSSGATLHARDLQAGVQKQGKKRHLVRIIGRLDVPEKQELGVYRGSVLLNVTIK